ncbi:MAG: hypothetical protein IKM61_08250 [Eubacteriaceae bacterium]|nr:hypothetical protein [Eubacteriaceae bacterium]
MHKIREKRMFHEPQPAEIPFQRNRAEEHLRSQNRSLPQILTDARCFDAHVGKVSAKPTDEGIINRKSGGDKDVPLTHKPLKSHFSGTSGKTSEKIIKESLWLHRQRKCLKITGKISYLDKLINLIHI